MEKYKSILSRLSIKKVVLLLVTILCVFSQDLSATHIVGGDISYSCISPGRYEVTLTIRRDCFFGEDDAPLDDPASIGVFDKFGSRLSYIGDFGQFLIPLIKNDTLNDILLSDCNIIGSPVCVQEGVYKDTLYLPYLEGGYFLAYQRCCRNQSLLNIVDPLETGSSYYIRITDEGQTSCNSSPVFKNWADIYICAGESMVFDHGAIDPEGDSLVYSLNIPNSGATFDDPMPQPPDNPPYGHITWQSSFNVNDMMGGVPLQIDANTGIMTATPNFIGQYLIGVKVEEFRNGELISILRRDFEYNVRACGIGPEAAFEIGEFECGELDVPFINQSLNTDFVRWYFDYPNEDPAFVSSEENPSFSFPDYGTYTVRLEAFRALDGCRTFDEQELTISPEALIVDFDIKIDSCKSDGFVINLTDLSQDPLPGHNIISQMWTVVTGTDTLSGIGSPIQFDVLNVDSVEVSLLVGSSRFCTESLTRIEALDGMIPLDFMVEVIACEGDNILVQLSESSNEYEAESWDWTISNANESFSGEGNPIEFNLPGEGEYQITLNAELTNGCAGIVEETIEIELPYIAAFDLQISECRDDGILINLTNKSENIPDNVSVDMVSWMISDMDQVYTANGETAEFLLPSEGQYQVDMLVELDNGCSFSFTDEVNISLDELFPIDFEFQVNACTEDGFEVLFNANDLQLPDYVTVSSWDWQISGEGITINLFGANPNTYLTVAGTYSVILTATLSNNCIVSLVKEQAIGLNDYGIGFSYEITGCENGEIQLQLNVEEGNIPAELGPASWNWEIDNGQNIIQANGLSPTVILPAEGSYIISLVAALNNGCTSKYTESVDIEFDNYGIGFEYLVSDCSDGKIIIDFTADAGNIPADLMPLRWEWLIESQFETVTSEGSNTSIGLSTDGEYTVTLKAILADGCPASYTQTIDIDLPGYNTSFSFEVLDCAAGDIIVQLHADSGDIPPELTPTDWKWYILGSNGLLVEASGANPQVLLDGAGNYSIELIAILANECPSSNTLDLQIELETYEFSFDYEQVGCDSEKITLSLTPDATNIPAELLPVSWEWVITGANTDIQVAGDNPQVALAAPGDYTVVLTAILANDCPASNEIEFSVDYENYNLGFNYDHLACKGEAITISFSPDYSNLPDGLDPVSWTWNISDGIQNFTSNDEIASFELPSEGSYFINLVVTLTNGCTASIAKTIEITANAFMPGFSFEAVSCEDELLDVVFEGNIDNVADGLTALSWDWLISNDTGFSVAGTGQNPQFTLSIGNYNVSLIATLSNGCLAVLDTIINVENRVYDAAFDLQISECRDDGILINLTNKSENIPDNVSVDIVSWMISGMDQVYTANGETVEFLLPSEGQYQVDMLVELDNGCSFSFTDEVNISLDELFPIDFEFQVNACTEDGFEVLFNANDLQLPDYVTVSSWDWQISGEGITINLFGANPNTYLTVAGTYSVILTATLSNNCIVSLVKEQAIGLNDYGIGFSYEITGCENGEIQLQLNVEEGNIPAELGPASWNWEIDNGQNIIQANGLSPTVILPAEGSYIISLVAALNNGCTSKYTESVDIEFDNYGIGFEYLVSDCSDGKIIIDFTADAGNIPADLMPLRWEWLIESQFETVTSEGSNTSIGLSTDGEYTVTLKAILADGCPASYTQTIDIDLPGYNTSFSFEVLDCAAGDIIVQLHADSGDIPPELTPTDWKWYILGSNGLLVEASGANPQVLLDGAGNYSIELIAILANECPSSNTLDLQIELETYEFSFDYEQVGCDSEKITLSLTPDATNIPAELLPVSWEWIITGANTNIQVAGDNPQVTLAAPGDYTVILTAILANDCPASNEIEFSVDYENYNLGFNYDHLACNGEAITISFSPDYSNLPDGLDPVSWTWNISDGIQNFISNDETPSIELPSEGSYTINLDVTLTNGCTASISETIEISANAFMPGFSFETVSCEDELVDVVFEGNIENVTDGLTALSWDWLISNDTGFSVAGTGQNPQFTLSIGNYNVSLIATLSNGCLAVLDTNINVENRLFDAAFNYEISGCFGDGLRINLASLSDNYPDGITAVAWSWQITNSNGSIDVNGENPFIILQSRGEYTVSLEVILSNGCLATIEQSVIFDVPDYLLDIEYAFSGCDKDGAIKILLSSIEDNLPEGTSIINWIWIVFDINDTQIFVESNPEVTLAQLGIYTVELQAVLSNGCQNTISKEIVVEMPNYQASFEVETFGCEAENPFLTLIGSVENLLDSDEVVQWDWLIFNSQDSTEASGMNPTIVLPDNGTYTIELIATLENGCELFYSDEISFDELEYTIDYSYNVLDCVPEGFLVQLIGDPGNIPDDIEIVSWSWEITTPEDIIQIEGIEVDVILPEEASYPINISVVLANGCTANLSGDFIFDSGFQADFEFQILSCEGDEILFQFSDNSAELNPDNTITSWNWTFSYEDQIIEMTGNDINILIPEDVNLNVQLQITLDNGCIANYEEILPVILDLMAAFDYDVMDCNVDSVSLTMWDESAPNPLGLSPIEFLWTIQLKDETIELSGDTIHVSVESTDFIIVNHEVLFDNGCRASIEEELTFEFPQIAFQSDTIPKCGLNPVTLLINPDPSLTYTWTPTAGLDFGIPPDFSNPLANPDTTTTYSVFVENEFCNAQGEITVVVGDNIELSITGDTEVCSEEEVLLEVSGAGVGAVYMWSDDQEFNNILSQDESILVSVPESSQTFYVTSEPDGICAVGVDSITITNQSINLSLGGSGVEGICAGDTIDLVLVSDDPSQELALAWASDPHIISALDSAVIQVIAFDTDDTIRLNYNASNQFNCSTSGIVEIPIGMVEEVPAFQLEAQDCGSLIVCFESSADDGNIVWDFGDANSDQDSSSLASVCYEYSAYGNYTVSLSSASTFCGFNTQQINVELDPVLELELAADTTGYCAGDEISLTVLSNNENADLIWEDSSGSQIGVGETILYDGPGNQFLTVFGSSNGCLDTISIFLEDYNFDVETLPVDLICKGQEIQVQIINNTNDPLTYSWQPIECIVSGGDTSSPFISVDESKDLIATITNTENGCIIEAVIPIDIIDFEVIIDAIPDQVINLGESVDLEVNGAQASDEFEWSTGETDPIITVSPIDTTMYYVTVTNDFGCVAEDSILISVRQPLCNEEDIFLPSAFSPNGDNINDVLFLRSNFVLLMELVIYDRWGEEVFVSTDINSGWNGRYKNTGELLSPDVYAYSLKVTCINDFTYIEAGNVSLLR